MARLKKTKEAVVNGAAVAGFPLVITDAGVPESLSLDYFLDLHRSGVAVSSIATYGQHLCDFICQMEVDEKTYDQVNDTYLEWYRNTIRERANVSGSPNSENYYSSVLRSVIHYLHWLESQKYLRGVVGEGSSCGVRIAKGRSGIKHPLAKNRSKDKRQVVTPRREWIEIVKANGPQQEAIAIRFSLMIDWAVVLGLRAMEICALRLAQLPSLETSKKAMLEGHTTYIKLLVTKGGKRVTVPVSPLLIKKTWDYVDGGRAEIVQSAKLRARNRREPFAEPIALFLSRWTCSSITPRAFSNAVRAAFLRAVERGDLTSDERVWLHGFRHHSAVNLLRELDRRGVDRPEAIARQVTRHSSDDALETYLTDRFNDDFDG